MGTEKPKQQQTTQPPYPEKQISICRNGQYAPSHMAAHFANRLDHHLGIGVWSSPDLHPHSLAAP